MVEDDDETESTERAPNAWAWADLLTIMSAGVSGYFALIGAMWSDVSDRIAEHAEFKRSQKDFARKAALEIEALTAAIERERVTVG